MNHGGRASHTGSMRYNRVAWPRRGSTTTSSGVVSNVSSVVHRCLRGSIPLICTADRWRRTTRSIVVSWIRMRWWAARSTSRPRLGMAPLDAATCAINGVVWFHSCAAISTRAETAPVSTTTATSATKKLSSCKREFCMLLMCVCVCGLLCVFMLKMNECLINYFYKSICRLFNPFQSTYRFNRKIVSGFYSIFYRVIVVAIGSCASIAIRWSKGKSGWNFNCSWNFPIVLEITGQIFQFANIDRCNG